MNVLVKVSGSLIEDEKFYKWLSSTVSPSDDSFILAGGGDGITKVLNEKAIPYKFGPQGREISSQEGKRLALGILNTEKFILESKLMDEGINATVFLPVLVIEGKFFHMNGDSYALALYPSFDKIYIVTLKGREKSFQKNLNKLKIIYL
jgi:hypothetical protein